MIEFVLTGIPILFIWLGTVQMSVAMFRYAGLQFGTKATLDYITLHGSGYVGSTGTPLTIADFANYARSQALFYDPTELTATFGAGGSGGTNTTVQCRLDNCMSNTTTWPPTSANTPGTAVSLKLDFTTKWGIGMYTPGSGTMIFSQARLPGWSMRLMEF